MIPLESPVREIRTLGSVSGCCFADYLVSVWLVYIDGLVRGFLTLFQFFRTVSVTVAGLRDEGRWRPENG